MTQNTILYSTAGAVQLLLAVPEAKAGLMGSYNWVFPHSNEVAVSEVATLPAPKPTAAFDHINVYRLDLKHEHGVQAFNMVKPIAPQFLPLVAGKVSMITHPVANTEFIHAQMPVGGVDQLPVLIAVMDQSGSTGYHWEQFQPTGALKTESMFFPPETHKIGAAGIRIFALTATEPGVYTTRFDLLPPAGHTPEASIVVNFAALEAK